MLCMLHTAVQYYQESFKNGSLGLAAHKVHGRGGWPQACTLVQVPEAQCQSTASRL